MGKKGKHILDPRVLQWIQAHQSMEILKKANDQRKKGILSANQFMKIAEKKFKESKQDPIKHFLGSGYK